MVYYQRSHGICMNMHFSNTCTKSGFTISEHASANGAWHHHRYYLWHHQTYSLAILTRTSVTTLLVAGHAANLETARRRHVDALNIAHVLLVCCPSRSHAHPLAHPIYILSAFFFCDVPAGCDQYICSVYWSALITTTVDKPPILHIVPC